MDKDFLLIRQMKSGDETAMDKFVRKYYPVIFRYCQYHISDRAYAEDLVQDTFERFFRSLPGYRHSGKALNYLYVIAGNLCRDFYRKMPVFAMAEFLEAGENPTDKIEGKIDLERALNCLHPEMREVIILHYFQELKLREIADILGVGLPLVKYRIKRAKEQLGTLLYKEGEH